MADSGGAVQREIRIGDLSAEATVDDRGLRVELTVDPADCPPPQQNTTPPPPAAPRPQAAPPAAPENAPSTPVPPLPPPDPYLLSTALVAGITALSTLPIVALALSGPATGTGAANNNGVLPAGGSLGTTGATITAEQLRAQNVLRVLGEVYGDHETTDPRIVELREKLGVSGGETGSSTAAIRARRLYHRTKAAAFNNLDNALYFYIQQLAQNNAVDQQAVRELLRELNTVLADLGPDAYTADGQKYVHGVVTAAMGKAQRIVSASDVSAQETAAAIDQLTQMYLRNISGKNYTPELGVARGGGSAAQAAVSAALERIGAPYVWGAEGPNSFDCSGLMQFSARSAGVDIPRTAAEQYAELPKLGANDTLRAGDLIFPASRFEGGRAKHVMMYIGGGMCVESPQPGGRVQQVALPEDFRATRWAR
ncbi:NlpC/P60 family protein [Nocardia vulneris]|uniref:C40 family peptidase n=1 Tax=Nocardia vulneris TaxID=1141657 RepID=UPI0030D59E25